MRNFNFPYTRANVRRAQERGNTKFDSKHPGKLLLRGGIMRTNRDGQRRFFVGFTKFAVLLMCFATVFALVLTAGVFDLGSDSSANVAEAEKTGGSTTQISNFADISPIQTFAHSNSNSQSFSYTLTGISSSNTSLYSDVNSSSGTNLIFWNDGTSNSWGVAGDDWWGYGGTLYAAINVQIPEVIQNLLAKGFTVSAYYKATLWGYKATYTKTTGIGLMASTGVVTASSQGSAGITTQSVNCGSGYDFTSRTVNISSGQNNLALFISREITTGNYLWGQSDSERASMIRAENTVVTFTITKPSKFSSDGYSPIATVDSNNSTLATDVGAYVPSDSSLYESIVSSANSLKDNISALPEEGGTINLTNAIARAGSISANGTTFGKKLTLVVTDRNEEGENANSSNATYYAGVAVMTVGGSGTGVSYGSKVTNTFTYTAEGGGVGKGYIEWTASSARETGVLTIYFSANTASPISLVLSDSGGSSVTYSINVGGIKTEGNEIGMTVTHNTAGWIVTSVEDPERICSTATES